MFRVIGPRPGVAVLDLLDLENKVSPTVAQPPGTLPSDLHETTDTGTFRKRLKSVLYDRAYH